MDLCLCYNILHKNVDTTISDFFHIETLSQTRGHSWKLKSFVPRLDSRLHFFSYRVTNVWNSLSEKTVSASSIVAFKNCLKSEPLDRFLVIKEWAVIYDSVVLSFCFYIDLPSYVNFIAITCIIWLCDDPINY